MKAVIVEDEVVAAQALQGLVAEIYPDIEFLAVLQSIDESVEWFRNHSMPDLVFLDIHLADGSSFSIFEEVDITCPIIFTTAYDEYALKAFEVNSIDYLLKPISKKELERAIGKYRNLKSEKSENTDVINKLLSTIRGESQSYRSNFLVPEKDKLIPLAVQDIAYIYIDAKMVKALSFNQKVYYLDQTLDELMEQLDPHIFFRANRQYIVAKAAIKDMSIWFGNKLSLNLVVETPERILISKAKVGEFKQWFAG